VESSVFDELLSFVGDLFMELSSMRTLSQTLRSIDFKDAIHMVGKTVNSLHTSILTARMLPIGDLTEGLPRVIRDITSKTGKSVSLEIEGAEISLDRAILEDLGGPLVHIIRNAVDHGIEDPSTREKAGKDPAGAIKIKAYARKDLVVLEVSDDGRGIDIEKVKVKAVADGMPLERIRRMSPQEILMLVCTPGLSTSTEVSDTSGRGVGMDVVKKAVEALGGSLTLESTAGKSTTVIMELPRTTSIIKVLFVDVADEMVMLPLSQILKVVEVERESVSGGVFRSDDEDLPVIPLGAALGIDHDESRQTCTIVVAEAGSSRVCEERADEAGRSRPNRLVAIQVDDFGEETDAYIKPLMPPISRVPGVSGITVTGDGRPVFLVDVARLISKATPATGIS
jgi:two-component system chemotaxis sensor kinase CheA